MNIALKPKAEKILQRVVAKGHYASEEEALNAAVFQLELDEAADWARVKRQVAVGLAELRRGEGRTYDRAGLKKLGDSIKRQGRRRLAKAARKN